MNMTKTLLAAALMANSAALLANDMYIDLGTNTYDTGRFIGTADANTTTATFQTFGLGGLLATSFYDFADMSVLGSFVDTNNLTEMANRGVGVGGAMGTGLDGLTTVTLNQPVGGTDDIIDGLNNIAPPLAGDNEGYLQTWGFRAEYFFTGNLTAGGPDFNGGTFKLFFDDFGAMTITEVLAGTFISADVAVDNEAAAVVMYLTVDSVRDNFLYADDGTGMFVEVEGGVGDTIRVDFNVDPAIPTADQLLLTSGVAGTFATRQAFFDGSASVTPVPVPATLALLGLGLLGVPTARRLVRS